MAKVGAEMGITIHIGRPENNEYFRFTVRIDEIDTEQPIEGQLGGVRNTLNKLVPIIEAGLEKKVTEELGRILR